MKARVEYSLKGTTVLEFPDGTTDEDFKDAVRVDVLERLIEDENAGLAETEVTILQVFEDA